MKIFLVAIGTAASLLAIVQLPAGSAYADQTCYVGCTPPFWQPPPPVQPHLSLSDSVVSPGEGTVAQGVGCPPDSEVFLSIGDELVGTTLANQDGEFALHITPPQQTPGQVTVSATCGDVRMSTLLSIIVTANSSSPGSSAGIFGVFVLLGLVLLRGQFVGSSKRKRKKPSPSAGVVAGNGAGNGGG